MPACISHCEMPHSRFCCHHSLPHLYFCMPHRGLHMGTTTQQSKALLAHSKAGPYLQDIRASLSRTSSTAAALLAYGSEIGRFISAVYSNCGSGNRRDAV
eukprot:scaffold134336_cov20-Tisochrysis_lutea.AAC.1